MSTEAKTILLVDDEKELLDLVAFHLSHAEKLNVITADCGSNAIEVLKKSDVDVILSDVRMPNGGGVSVLNHIKDNNVDIPVIFYSGFQDADRGEVMRLGAYAYLQKPVDFNELSKVLKKVLN